MTGIGGIMAKKKKSASAGRAKRKKKSTQEKQPKRTKRPLLATGLTLRAETALSQCPTHVYDGTVLLKDAEQQSFLQTSSGTYLMLIDADCSGLFTPSRVTDAYLTFSANPGRNQRLTCNGFLHQDGSAHVLHVVS
jgi:hypothetical protein